MTDATTLYNDAGTGVFTEDPGLHGYVDLTNEQYHSGPGISKSQLDAVAISPLNYWDQYINPEREPREYKHAFAVGDGTHKLVLEPGTFEETYAVDFDKHAFPDALDTIAELKKELGTLELQISGSKPELADRLINEGGFPPERIMLHLQRQHQATMTGRIPIPARDYKNMLSMLRAVDRDPIAGPLLRGATTEQSFFWRDDVGILRKCRTDAISADGVVIPDLKTTDDVSASAFGWTIYQRRYHVQAAFYLDILRGLYGSDAPRVFAFVAAQKTRPYDVAVHYLTEEHIQAGRLLYQRDLALLTDCMARDYWPGVARGQLIEAQLPQRAMDILYEAN
ncbi:putative Exodeoxyribonuclease 8 [Hyphomicrobiales bacterium]|nr:putative Exodeoxyribonuclease 8 [Hyphomicrobiales bacterium]CAH1671746.1 Exodeoxyribonuclease VIII [Hyphomicrobiales bacterium]